MTERHVVKYLAELALACWLGALNQSVQCAFEVRAAGVGPSSLPSSGNVSVQSVDAKFDPAARESVSKTC